MVRRRIRVGDDVIEERSKKKQLGQQSSNGKLNLWLMGSSDGNYGLWRNGYFYTCPIYQLRTTQGTRSALETETAHDREIMGSIQENLVPYNLGGVCELRKRVQAMLPQIINLGMTKYATNPIS